MPKANCRPLNLILLVLLVLFPTACQLATPVPPEAATAQTLQSEFIRNLQKWKDAGISHYRFRLFRACICYENEDVFIEVEDGEIVSIEHPSRKTMNPDDRMYFEGWGTMERLFSTAENELNGDALEVTVKYDPTYGFPVLIFSVPSEVTDDELDLTISDFEVLP